MCARLKIALVKRNSKASPKFLYALPAASYRSGYLIIIHENRMIPMDRIEPTDDFDTLL